MLSGAPPLPRCLTGRTRRRDALALGVVAALAIPAGARADPPLARRAVPDYDGRGASPPDAVETAACVPRVVLSPLRLSLEAVRWPSRRLLRNREVYRAWSDMAGYSTDLAEDPAAARQRVSVLPLVVVDVGRRVHAGLAVDLAGAPQAPHRLSLLALTGGERFFVADAWERVTFGASDAGMRVRWWERPDNPAYGPPGPATRQDDSPRFWMRRVSAEATTTLRPAPWFALRVASGVHRTEIDLGALPWAASPQHAGVDRYTACTTDADATLDSGDRSDRAGARLTIGLRHGVDLQRSLARRWVVAQARAAADVEVMRPGRLLGLEVVAAIADAPGREPVPFAELPALGGDAPMRGFLHGRFRGPTVAAAALRYRWPIWIWLEAETRLAAGNTFGPGFAGLRPGALFGSWDLAVRSRGDGLSRIELLLGLGTNRFDSPALAVEHVRVLLALERSF
jgi:hypothetical protein